ncbi:hypothetical protein ACM6PT_44340, partial [Klebsiella pneumoniae]
TDTEIRLAVEELPGGDAEHALWAASYWLFARDPDTGEEIWMRPFVEGHMGRLNGKDSTVTGDVKAPSWPDDRNSPTGKVES